MIPGLETLACQDLAVPMDIMEHVVRVESSLNPYAIGVVGARLARQPRSLDEAVATARRLERDGYNFSLGLAQVNRHNLASQGLASWEDAFAPCPNLAAGARILAECHARADGDWDRAFSCYYSGNFTRGFRDGYVEKIRRSMLGEDGHVGIGPHGGAPGPRRLDGQAPGASLVARRSVRDLHSPPEAGSQPPPAPREGRAEGAAGGLAGHVDASPPDSTHPFSPTVTWRYDRTGPADSTGTHRPPGDAAFVF